jgi:hypothetical protein
MGEREEADRMKQGTQRVTKPAVRRKVAPLEFVSRERALLRAYERAKLIAESLHGHGLDSAEASFGGVWLSYADASRLSTLLGDQFAPTSSKTRSRK